MLQASKIAVMAACALLLSMGAHCAFAAENSVKIPTGAKTEIRGNTAIINNGGGGGNNNGGTYNCYCANGAGSCVLLQTGPILSCHQAESKKCDGTCELLTTTGGASSIAAPTAKQKSKSQ